MSAIPLQKPCGHCKTGSHGNCPRAVRNPGGKNKIYRCGCENADCQGGQILRCLDCKTEEQDQINPNTWACIDQEACRDRVQARLDANPVIQQIGRIRSKAMADEQAKAETEKVTKSKTGECLCCGGETKGGKFLPGHDARHVSDQVALVLGGQKNEDEVRAYFTEKTSANLTAKFNRSLTLGKEKAAKKAKDKADKEAAKDNPAEAKADAEASAQEAVAEVQGEDAAPAKPAPSRASGGKSGAGTKGK